MKLSALALTAILFGATAGEVQAQRAEQVVGTAHRLELLADDLLVQLGQRTRTQAGFRGAERAADELWTSAENLHDLVNVNVGQRRYVAADKHRLMVRDWRDVQRKLQQVREELNYNTGGPRLVDPRRHTAAYRFERPEGRVLSPRDRLERTLFEIEDTLQVLGEDLRIR